MVWLAACSSSADASGSYAIEFPSESALLSTETVDVDVFDASADPSICITLSERVRTNQALPEPLTELPRIDPCVFFAGSGEGSLHLSSGSRAILVRANRGGAPYLVGCTRFDAGPGFTTTVTVSLLAGVAAPPAPQCASMEARCRQGAKC